MKFVSKLTRTVPRVHLKDAYLSDLGIQFQLGAIDTALLRWIVDHCQPDGTIVIVKGTRELIASEVHSSANNIMNALGRLKSKNLIISIYNSGYALNKQFLLPAAQFNKIDSVEYILDYQIEEGANVLYLDPDAEAAQAAEPEPEYN